MQEEPIINPRLLLERFPGKGGWTYARLPDIETGKKNHFGWQKVRGFIDGYEVKQFHLMPLGEGKLMIAVKAEIRKAINKSAGDWVDVILYSLQAPLPVPEDFQLCLQDEPLALNNFQKFSEVERKEWLDWIYAVRSEEVIIERMANAINKLVSGHPVISAKA